VKSPVSFRRFGLLLILLLGGCGWPGFRLAPADRAAAPTALESPSGLVFSPDGNAFYFFSLANLLATEGDLDGSLAALEKARELDPGSTFLHLALAEVYLRQGEEEPALRAVEDALATDPASLDAHILLARLHFNRKEYAPAVAEFRAAVALDPDDENLQLQLAVALSKNGEAGAAIDSLKAYIAAHPEVETSYLALARLYRETGLEGLAESTYLRLLKERPDLREAKLDLARFYESAPGSLDRALEIYRQLLAEDPADSRLRHHLAAVLISVGKLGAARDELEALLQFDPGNLEARRKLGLIAIEQERWSDAVALFRGLVEEQPDFDQVRYYLGVAYERQGDLPAALDSFAAIADDSSFADDALMHRAYLLDSLERTGEAIALLEARLKSPADRADVYIFLSSLYGATGQDAAALECVNRGLAAFPENLQLLYQRGILFEKGGQHDQAAEVMKQILLLDPKHAEALNYLAYRWAERNENLEQALAYAQRALALSDLPHIHDTLGWVLFRRGEIDAALAQLQKAADGLPGDEIVLEHLADVCQAAGLHDLAVLYYRKILEKDPENREIKQKLEKSLQQLKD